MRVLGEHPKQHLRPIRLHLKNGQIAFRTGYNAAHTPGHMTAWQLDELRKLGAERWEAGPNVVVEAALRPEKNHFVDRDSGFVYEATPRNLVEILKAGIDGRLRIEQGHVVGRFTFAQPGAIVSIALYKGRVPGKPVARVAPDAPAGAPDLSDFVRSLGRATAGA